MSAARERAVAAVGMPPLHPAPGCLERDPEAMWAAVCDVTRKVLSASGVEPSSIAAVGLTGYGNGLFLVDRDGRPVRNAILSPDLRAQAIVARWRAEGAEARSAALTYNPQFPGKPLPLIAWLEAHEPEALQRADRALFCKDYLRFRLTGAIGLEISDMSSASLADQRLRRWTPDVLEPFGLSRYARLFGDGVEPLTIAGAVTEKAAAETGLAAGTSVSAGYADGPAMALGLGATDESLISVIAGTWGLNQLATSAPVTEGTVASVIAGPEPGVFVVTDAGPTSASAFEWFVDSIVGRADMSHRSREVLFDFCNEEVLRARADGDIPYFLPYLNGRLEQPRCARVLHRARVVARTARDGARGVRGRGVRTLRPYRPSSQRPQTASRCPLRRRSGPQSTRGSTYLPRRSICRSNCRTPMNLALWAQRSSPLWEWGSTPTCDAAVAAMTRVARRIEPDRELSRFLAKRRRVFEALRDRLSSTWGLIGQNS